MSHFAEASRSFTFEFRLNSCDPDLQKLLKDKVTVKPALFAHLTLEAPGSDKTLETFRNFLIGLGVDAAKLDQWAVDCTALHSIALGEAPEIVARTASLTGFQQTADILEMEDGGFQTRERDDAARASLLALAHLPSQWKGKRYRRTEGQPSAHAREEGERTERLRQGRQVAGLLVEADLPFAASLKHKAPEDVTILRCCRGLRSSTLAQRLSTWRPFRRFLLHSGHGPWPNNEQVVLDYFDLKVEEGLAPSTLPSFLAALSFFEEAGELPQDRRLTGNPAIDNASREHSLAAEERAKATRKNGQDKKQKKKGQAPPLLLMILISLEMAVLDTMRPLYHRAFAWYRLFRHWASLRWDDTQGLVPSSLERRSRGVFGLLERTKTSGPGKRQDCLPVWVSNDAHVRYPWLDVGLALWLEGPLSFPRDYFLPLPTSNFQGALEVRAKYSDSAGFSRALFATLTDKHGKSFLSESACRFWTEHSDRAGLDGWCMALGVSEPERSFLGRWAAKSSTDTYVRTALRVVENLQCLAARHAQAAALGGPDFYGEEHILRDLAAHLVRNKVSEHLQNYILKVLTLPDFSKPIVPLENIQAAVLAAPPEGYQATEPADSEGDGVPTPIEIEADPDLQPLAQEAVNAAVAEQAVAVVPFGYVISKTKRGKCLRLHFLKDCWMVPGVHYRDFDVWGDSLPAEADITCVCLHCMPLGRQAAEDGQALEAAEQSSSSSGVEVPATVKKPRVGPSSDEDESDASS